MGSVAPQLTSGTVDAPPSTSGELRGDGPVLIVYDRTDEARAAVDAASELFPGAEAVVLSLWYSPTAAGTVDEQVLRDAEQAADEGATRARARGLEAARLTSRRGLDPWTTINAEADRLRAVAVVIKSPLLASAGGSSATRARPLLVACGTTRAVLARQRRAHASSRGVRSSAELAA